MPLESPKTHFAFAKCTQWEVDFITEIVRQTGCSLLLDVNNVHVASTNRKWDSFRYIDAYPLAAVRETHLAGHAREVDEKDRSLLIDIHDRPVEEIVRGLFAEVISKIGPMPTPIEWDADMPASPQLKAEADRADTIIQAAATDFRNLRSTLAAVPQRR
jgi:uncharacterized protein (UPF0276 family)